MQVWHPNDTWTLYTADSEAIKSIFNENSLWYKTAGGVPAQMLVGQGLTSVNGQQWKRQRNVITKLFQPSRVDLHTETLRRVVEKHFTKFREHNKDTKVVDLSSLFRTVSLDINITSAIGFMENADEFAALFSEIWTWWRSSTAGGGKSAPPIASLKRILIDVVSKRQKGVDSGGVDDPSFLTTLLKFNLENSQTSFLQFDEIVDNLVSFLLAGYETLAHCVTMCIYLSGTDKSFQDELFQEIDGDFDASKPTLSELSKLTKLELLIKETLRLYHPVGGASRYPQKEVTIAGIVVPQGHRVITDTIPAHRDPKIWRDPNDFCPCRWDQPQTQAMKDAYMPWGSGQRYCVGTKFGMFSIKLVLALFLKKFKVEVDKTYRPVLHLTPTLTLQNGLPVTVIDRNFLGNRK